tara:strand:+ start:1346 stop:2428 length:1083 start_codon:yes stop_codon:yes gene_type:complete
MKLLLELPLNNLSFGNVSINLLQEFHKRDLEVGVFPTGDVNVGSFDLSDDFKKYIEDAVNKRFDFLSKDVPALKLWHLNGSENRKNKNQFLYTFYECNEPTAIEKTIAASQEKTIFSSTYARDHFASKGLTNCEAVPLGLDPSIKSTGKEYMKDCVHFGLMGKYENRKHTQKIIQTWLKKYGNNNKYLLTCCITNPFFKPEQMQGLINQTLQGEHYNNINFLPHLATNKEVNEYLNSIDIDLGGLSGGEGWNLPSFNATCLGKWSIVLNSTSHKDWANDDNSILVEPSGDMPVSDGVFFSPNQPFNQGTFYTWTEDEAIAAMEKAESKAGQINTEGVKMGDNMTYGKTVDSLLSLVFQEK